MKKIWTMLKRLRAAAKEHFYPEDLELNDKNEIIKGSVQPNQHPLNVRSRPQPTWYKR